MSRKIMSSVIVIFVIILENGVWYGSYCFYFLVIECVICSFILYILMKCIIEILMFSKIELISLRNGLVFMFFEWKNKCIV